MWGITNYSFLLLYEYTNIKHFSSPAFPNALTTRLHLGTVNMMPPLCCQLRCWAATLMTPDNGSHGNHRFNDVMYYLTSNYEKNV